MSQSIQIQVTQVGLEQSIAAAMRRVGSSSQINLGTSSKQINALSQPLGRITGQADEFSKSMAAANARVLAFGASAGIIAGVSKAMSGLVTSTIKVEKSLVEINSVLNKTGAELDKFGQDIFNVAKNTGKSFDEVANGALELARQGLNAEDTLARLNDALILSRLSGLDAAQSVEGLTAAFNSFQKSGITTAEILNKVVAVSQKYAVSERDIIEGVKRSASVAQQAGVSFEELAAVITAVQQTTARGGAVIGNSFKTIFARIQRKDVLSDLQNMGVAVTDLQGNVLPALRILENLAGKLNNFSQIEQADIAEKLGGVFQLDKLLAALKDISDKSSVTSGALKVMGEAGNSAYQKNIILNQTLAALLNKVAVSAEQLGAKLGEIGVTDSLKNVLGIFNDLLEGIQKVLGEESGLGNLVRGLVKGLGSFLAGPGLALFGGIILKLSKDLVQFGFASLKAFFGIGKAAKEVQNVEGAISQILAKNVNLQQQLFALEGNRAAQLRVITAALVEQEAVLRRSSQISSGLAAPLYNVGARATGSGLRIGNSADGYMPAVAKESKAIKQGVGGARSGDRPVVMPNFNFGGGKKGTMVAHTGEYVVPNFNGSGGTAVFNRQMVQSMGLPSGAKKINAAGGLIPNFAKVSEIAKYNPRVRTALLQSKAADKRLNELDLVNLVNNRYKQEFIEKLPNESADQYEERVTRKLGYQNNDTLKYRGSSAVDGFSRKSNSIKLLEVKSGAWNSYEVLNKFLRALPENYGTGNLLDIWTNNRDDIKVEAAIASPINKNFSAKQSGLFARSANGFIPNFAPKFNAETVRKYANEIEKYKLPTKDFYQFPDGTGGYGSQIKNVLSRTQSKAVANQQIKEKKIEDKGFFNLNADALGGILLVSPRFGKGQGSLDTSMQIGEIPFFNQDKSLTVDKNKYIKLAGIKTSNTPSGRDLKSLRADVNELFSDGIVKLAYRLYGETFDPASGGEFSSKLQSLDASRKQQLLPPAAQGDLFEAAGKVALNSFANLESLFGAGEQNRPFDFQNPEALRKVFGVSAKRGEAKRGGEKNFSSSKQVQGIIKKIFNDSEYGPSAVKSLKSQGAFNLSEAQKAAQAGNAFGGYIPNFAQIGQFIGSGQESDVFRKGNRVIKYSKGDQRQASEKAQLNKAMNWEAAKNQLNNIYKDGKLRILKTFQREGFSMQAFAGETGATVIKDKLKAFKLSDLIDRKFEEARSKNSAQPNWLSPLFFDPDPRNFTFLNGVKGDVNNASVEEIFNANKFGLIDMGVYPLRLPDIKKRAAGGFLPNFANPLQEAVGREMAAGVPASQIYIDKSPALKNAANPMGLMVANRRDEPAGGFQGINRARREGANPMMYGAADGFVPNYAAGGSGPDLTNFVGLTRKQALEVEAKQYGEALIKNTEALVRAKKELDKIADKNSARAVALDAEIKALNENKKTLNENSKATRKAIQEQTKGVLGSGRTLTGGQARVSGPSAGGSRDMLGTIFAVQGAMTALAGATDGATSGFGFFANTLGDAASTASTVAFGFSGIGQMLPQFSKQLGVAGLAIGAVTLAYKIGTAYYNKMSGITSAVASSVEMMGKAAEGAAISLNTIGAARKEEIQKRAKQLSGDLGYGDFKEFSFNDTSDSGISTSPSTYISQNQAKFEGSIGGVLNNDLRDQYNKVFESALAQQVPEDVLKAAADKIKNDGFITAGEIKSFSAEIADAMENASKEVNKFLNSIKDNPIISDNLAKMDNKQFAELLDTNAIQGDEARAKAAGYTNLQEYKTNYQGYRGKDLKTRVLEALGMTSEEYNQRFSGMTEAQVGDVLTAGRDKARAISKEKDIEEPQKERDFQANLGRLQAEIKLDEKLNTQKKAIFSQEQDQKEALAKIENDISISENDRSKVIASINKSYGETIALLTEQEQKTKNIGDALIGGLTGVPGIAADQIAGFAEQISEKLPEFDINNITEYQNKLIRVFKEIKLPQAAIKPLLEALTEAEKTNKAVSDEREKQIAILEKEYGIQIKTINATSDKLSLEKQISAQIEARNSEASFKIENRVLNNAYETLSINKEIERIKRETSLNELQKAEQVYKLELKRRNLESTGIGIGLEQRILDIDQELINKAREALTASGVPANTLKADFKIEDLQRLAPANSGAVEQIGVAIANAQRQRDLAQKRASNEQASLGDVVPDDTITRASEGLLGGMKRGVAALENQTNTFASTLGEKIPQMFSDNMSNAINKMIEGGESFGNILQGAAYEFVKGINQANIQNLSNKFSNFLFKSDGGVGSGIASMLRLATGGKVTGGSGSKDDVPAMLMGGEYVVNKRAVAKYGPQFLEAINNGTLSGYAKGGTVQRGPQGNFYTPGTFGQGAISGKRNLLDFATQSGTSGVFDQIINESGYQAISLEPESSRLSVSGMRSTPMFEATQSAKGQAFDLYLQQYNAEREAKKQAKEQKKALMRQVGMLALSAALGPALGAAGAGFKAAFGAAKAGGATGFQSFLAGTKGIVTGGKIPGMEGNVGGLGNLFSGVGKAFTGDFGGAVNKFKLSQIGTQEQLLSAMKNEKFASYINQQGGFIPKAEVVQELGGIPIGASRGANGVTFNSNDGDIIKNIQGDVGVYGSDIEAGLLPSMQGKSGFFKSIGSGANKIGSIFSNFLGSGYGPFDKDGNYVEEWADNPSKWGISQFVRRATGGTIPSTSGIDTVPAMLSGGEFVMNRSAVQSIGAPNLQSMNAGGTSITSEETSKELNEKLLAKLDELIKVSDSSAAGNITINVAPSGRESQESGSQDASASRQQLARQIKDAVLQVINDEKRIGGSLRR